MALLNLLQPLKIGRLTLSNRITMAPMTRGRSTGGNYVPPQLLDTYYTQRASAGLIITEGTWVSRQAVGFMGVPGIFSSEQAEGWKAITNSVHEKGGLIFCQLGHVGTLNLPEYLDGELPRGPSAVNPNIQKMTTTGMKNSVTAKAMTLSDIRYTLADYRTAAQYAKDAGFDGVQIHAQNPSLLSQFLSDKFNQRTDEYGGSIPNKARLLFEVISAVTDVWGDDRVSVRINPYLSYSGPEDLPEDTLPLYKYIIERLNNCRLAFLDVLDRPEPSLSAEEHAARKLFETIRPWYNGILMANGGLTRESAEALVDNGIADLVSFGSLYISNPDLVYRFEHDLKLNQGDPSTFILGDEKGYTDYPFATITG